MRRSSFRAYNRFLLRFGPLALALGFVVAMVSGHLSANFWVFRCTASGYSDEYYLSYCPDRAYGDFEHGALYYPNDPPSVENARRADMLLLGNSRAARAFSADVLPALLDENGIRMFNLAFNGEWDLFPRTLMERHDLRPRYVVVNADYFFYGSVNVMGRRVLLGGAVADLEYRLKTWVQGVHIQLCGRDRSPVGRVVCGEQPAQFRSRIDGRTINLNWPADDPPRLTRSTSSTRPGIYPSLLSAATDFRNFVQTRGGCLILTQVPAEEANPQIARDLARDLGVPFVETPDTGYETFDGSHMNPLGANRWAAEFAKELPAALAACR